MKKMKKLKKLKKIYYNNNILYNNNIYDKMENIFESTNFRNFSEEQKKFIRSIKVYSYKLLYPDTDYSDNEILFISLFRDRNQQTILSDKKIVEKFFESFIIIDIKLLINQPNILYNLDENIKQKPKRLFIYCIFNKIKRNNRIYCYN